jgi:FlaA1/EpsC-like NDP-sugar epimerase
MVIAAMNETTGTHFVTVRFGNVAGSNGSVVQLFDQQLRRNLPLTVTDRNATRFFMSIPEAVRLVLQAGAFARAGGIFMLDMGTPVNIYELARTMIRLSGQRPDMDVPIKFTGLASAEKMNEELTDTGEDALPTAHPRILGIKSSEALKGQRILERLPEWRQSLRAGEHQSVFAELPEFWPADTQVNLNKVLADAKKPQTVEVGLSMASLTHSAAGGN